ncbi:MAG TPA: DUF58 domain-containing protein [Gammaproteobacteria bacterium]|nr:DUF58 domain-containing protein [Gammaproteobacteria bacterium]
MMPGRRLFVLLWLWAAAGVAVSLHMQWVDLWWLAGGAIALAGALDALLAWQRAPLRIERRVMGSLPLGVWSTVELKVHNPNRAAVGVEIFDHVPQSMDHEGLPAAVTVPGGGWARVRYRLRPTARGILHFAPAQVRQGSPLALWRPTRRIGAASTVHVYPNFAAVSKYALLAHDQRQNEMGIRKRRRRGEGLEFHQLREYRDGDSMRQIDWKATSRLHKLISRDYQDERDQRVVFLVDCGRRMRAADGDLSHFDHTLNALLLLSYVALRQGDAVGLMTFSGDGRWLAPRKGAAAVNLVLNTVYDLQPGLQAPDYSNAATEFMVRQRKRALVVLVTNVRDEDTDDLLPALHLLRRRHLVLLASLKEGVIDEALDAPVDGFDSALEHAAAQEYLVYRREAHNALEHQGVLTLDVRPDQLPVGLVNRYLQIKSSGML